MSWMCEPVEVAVIEHWARCGTCGWLEKADHRLDAQRRCDSHRVLHEDIWELSGNTDLGEYLNRAPENVECHCRGFHTPFNGDCPLNTTPENVEEPK